jgi:hypothetical protein
VRGGGDAHGSRRRRLLEGSGGGAMAEHGPAEPAPRRGRKDSRAAEPPQQQAVAAAQAAARRAEEYRDKQRAALPSGNDRKAKQLSGAKVSPIVPDARGARGLDDATAATAAHGAKGSGAGGDPKARAAGAAASEAKAGGVSGGKGVGALREELDEAVKLLAELEARPLGTSNLKSATPRATSSSGSGDRHGPTKSCPAGALGAGAGARPTESSGALNEGALAAAAENLRLRASFAKVASAKGASKAAAPGKAPVAVPAARAAGAVSGAVGAAVGAATSDNGADGGETGGAYAGSPPLSDETLRRREAFNEWCRRNAGSPAAKQLEASPIQPTSPEPRSAAATGSAAPPRSPAARAPSPPTSPRQLAGLFSDSQVSELLQYQVHTPPNKLDESTAVCLAPPKVCHIFWVCWF